MVQDCLESDHIVRMMNTATAISHLEKVTPQHDVASTDSRLSVQILAATDNYDHLRTVAKSYASRARKGEAV